MRSFAFLVIAALNTEGFSKHQHVCGVKNVRSKTRAKALTFGYLSHNRFEQRRKATTNLGMVRNVDTPEAIVFYGHESIFEPPKDLENDNNTKDLDYQLKLRSGVLRILEECREVGTAALILSEANDKEAEMKESFSQACGNSYGDIAQEKLKSLIEGKDPILFFRSINTKFSAPDLSNDDQSADAEYLFYNLLSIGRSPSPAFLLDSLQSIHIDPRGFGGSSGFARGQWIEPPRSPLPARTVVFVAGDWNNYIMTKFPWLSNENVEYQIPSVQDRCAAVRAAGCRIIYLENLEPNIPINDDERTISLCDAVISSYGNDNPRDLQPISLDTISTPGDYWLNPPCPRDDSGNAVVASDIIEVFRAERLMQAVAGDVGCLDNEDKYEDGMSDDEMKRILADLDDL